MTVELVTGYAGVAHISAADDGWRNAGTFGAGKYVLPTGTQLACEVQSATLATLGVGDVLFEGRHVRISETENVSIDNGAQGQKRYDIIALRYQRDTSTGVEVASIEVLKGTPTTGTPADPTVPSGSILENASTAYFPLWRIPIDGITVGEPVKLYGDVLVTLEEAGMGEVDSSRLAGTIAAARIPSLDASKIGSGTLADARIPNLAASKITSGTLSADRIPSLNASKITAGTFAADRIPSLDASKIGSGTLSADRIPSLAAGKIASGTFADARIPNLNASKITAGTLPVARGGTGKTSGTFYGATVLYNNSTGTTGTVTLSASAANYTMIDILFRTNDSEYGSVRVYSPNGKTVNLVSASATATTQMLVKAKRVSISGTSIANKAMNNAYGGEATITSSNSCNFTQTYQGIYITQVIGWA